MYVILDKTINSRIQEHSMKSIYVQALETNEGDCLNASWQAKDDNPQALDRMASWQAKDDNPQALDNLS